MGIMQEIMEEERDEQIGIAPYEKDNTKIRASRNGYKSRSFNTRVGALLLAKPQIRDYPFHTQLFENYQRSERALLSSIYQVVTDGISTNRVKEIVCRLPPDLAYSKPTVSRVTQELYPQIKRWQDERLKDYYTYIITDTLYFYVMVDHQVVSSPLLITIGIDKCGYRKIPGADSAYDESYQSYPNHFSKSHRGD